MLFFFPLKWSDMSHVTAAAPGEGCGNPPKTLPKPSLRLVGRLRFLPKKLELVDWISNCSQCYICFLMEVKHDEKQKAALRTSVSELQTHRQVSTGDKDLILGSEVAEVAEVGGAPGFDFLMELGQFKMMKILSPIYAYIYIYIYIYIICIYVLHN